VYSLLKQEILGCVRASGEALVEHELSTAYGVSKTPVREALGKLAQEGLVNLISRRGWVVAPVTLDDIQHGYHLRLILEPEAARLAARSVGQNAIDQLRQSIAIYEKQLALPPNQTALNHTPVVLNETTRYHLTILDSNVWFHTTIAQASGNAWLTQIIVQIVQKLQRAILNDPEIDLPQEHTRIVDALEARDGERAGQAMKAHVNMGFHRVMDRFMVMGR
jgi:DNA-binding GntR family transcriptional regulator